MSDTRRTFDYPPVPQGVFGVCEGCGAVAWELLSGVSPLCMGCDSMSYQRPEDDDPCAYCDCDENEECR